MAATDEPAVQEVAHLDTALLGPQMMFEAFDTASMNLFDVDEDGVVEIVSQNDNNRLYVIDPLHPRLEAELTTDLNEDWGARTMNGVAIGDVDADGDLDLVSANSAGRITLFSRDDAGAWTEVWATTIDRRKLDPNFTEYRLGMDGAPYLADVDDDGKLEVFAQLDNTYGHAALDDDGSVLWFHPKGDGNANPVVDDLDGDGDYEAIFATDGGRILVYDALSGKEKWRFDSKDYGNWPGSIPVAPGVYDLDEDGKKEIYFGARQADDENATTDPMWYMKQHAYFFSLDHEGDLRWWNQYPPHGNPLVYNHPAALDVNGDGTREIVFLDWNTIGHKPGQWNSTGAANLLAIEQETGELVWRAGLDIAWSNKDFVVADVVGDDAPEFVLTAIEEGRDGLLFLNLNGERVGFVPIQGDWHASRGPVYADLDGDGTGEIVLPVMRSRDQGGCRKDTLDVGCREGALKIFTTGKPVNAPFPANFLFNAQEPEVVVENPDPQLADGPKDWTADETNVTYTPPEGDNGDGDGGESPVPALSLGVLVAAGALVALATGPRRRRHP